LRAFRTACCEIPREIRVLDGTKGPWHGLWKHPEELLETSLAFRILHGRSIAAYSITGD
jgi:hypothetical protein